MKRIEALEKCDRRTEWRVQTTAGRNEVGVLAVGQALLAAIPGIEVSSVLSSHTSSLHVSGVWGAEWEGRRPPVNIDELNKILNETPYVRENGVVIHPPNEICVTMTFRVTESLMAYARLLTGVIDVGRVGSYPRTFSLLYAHGVRVDSSECERVRKHMSFEF